MIGCASLPGPGAPEDSPPIPWVAGMPWNILPSFLPVCRWDRDQPPRRDPAREAAAAVKAEPCRRGPLLRQLQPASQAEAQRGGGGCVVGLRQPAWLLPPEPELGRRRARQESAQVGRSSRARGGRWGGRPERGAGTPRRPERVPGRAQRPPRMHLSGSPDPHKDPTPLPPFPSPPSRPRNHPPREARGRAQGRRGCRPPGGGW